MPGFSPGRRWQPAYSPFQKESFGERALRVLEYSVKGPLFGCRMCGNCLLQETALICPMECPKGLRNGPCGGSTSKACYVDKSRPCVWYEIYERSGNAQEEGIQIALEIIGKIRRYEQQGIHGIHLMPIGRDEVIPRIVTEARLLPNELQVSNEVVRDALYRVLRDHPAHN